MSRIVRGGSGADGDDYLDRAAKYVPVEIVAAYLAINKLFAGGGEQLLADPDPANWKWQAGVFVLCAILTPIYIWRVAKKGDDWAIHAAVSFVAFPVWAFAIGGLIFDHYRDYLGPPFMPSIALIIFSLVSGLITPRPPDKLT
jgi:hypothetical protein